MAGRNRPSFLKRQKEQQRLARAQQKREERRARKQAKSLGLESPDGFDEPTDEPSEDTESSEAESELR